MGTKPGGTMNLREKSVRARVWGCAVASFALVTAAVAIVTPRNSVAMSAAVVEASADAAAGVTFKIVPADVADARISWAPLTGDGSN